MNGIRLITLALLFATGLHRSAQGVPSPIPATPEELRAAIRQILEETRTPGASVALIHKEGISEAWGFGLADLAASRQVTPDTLFRAGSVSKSFVSLTLLKLCEQGRVRLEDSVRDSVPEVEYFNPWEATDPLRIVHLLEHTGGFDDIHVREYAHNDPTPFRLLQGLQLNPKSRTCRWRPGLYFSYCNSGPAVAAYIVEKICGQTFEEYVEENLLEPLGMSTAGFLLEAGMEEILAKGYGGEDLREIPYQHILMRPAGSLNSSAKELGHLVQMLINRGSFEGRQVLTGDSISRMEAPTSTRAAREGIQVGYGLGNYTSAHRGFLFHGHDGGIGGFLTSYAYLPSAGVGYVFMMNAAKGKAFREIVDLLRGYLTRDLQRPSPPLAEVPASRLQALARYYEPITPRQELSHFLDRVLGVVLVRVEGGKLTVDPLLGETEDLIPVTDRRYRGEDDPVASVIFLPGQGEELIIQGFSSALSGNFRSRSAILVSLERMLWILVLLFMLSSPLFAVTWIPRWFLGRLRIPQMSLHVLPLAAVLFLTLAVGVFYLCVSSPLIFERLGHRTPWSLFLFALTWLFAGCSIAGLFRSLQYAGRSDNRNVWVHSLVVSISNCLLAAYLYYWGIIGLRTWV